MTQTAETVTAGGTLNSADPAPYLALFSRWNAELIDFYLGCLQQYSLIPFRVFDFRSVESMMQAQTDFCRQVAEDCKAEAKKLAEIADEELGESSSSPETTYEAQLLKAQEDARQIIRLAEQQAERIIADAEKEAAQRRQTNAGLQAEGDSAAA